MRTSTSNNLYALAGCLMIAAAAAMASGAHAQGYPTKPIRIIVGASPGGGTDFMARLLGPKLAETLGQQVIVDNRPGAGSTLGYELGARAAPDGYTLTMITPSWSINPSLYPIKFDPVNDYTPVVFATPQAGLPQVKAGRVRAIAVTTPERVAAAPEVPTAAESGVPGYEVTNWHGMIGPKGLPRAVVERMNTEVNKAIRSQDLEEKLQANGVSAAGGNPELLYELIRREIGQWRQAVSAAGVKIQ